MAAAPTIPQAPAERRSIWSRRAEVGLGAPDAHLRSSAWDRFRVLAIARGDHGYDPWPSFAKAHHSSATFVLVSGGERVGKSLATAAEGFAWLPESDLIWIAGPHYADTLKEFDYLAEGCRNAGMNILEERRSEGAPSVLVIEDRANRRKKRIQTKSLYDIEKALIAEAPDIVLVVEAGQIRRDPIEKLRLRVSTKRGRVWLSGTLEDASPWFVAAYERWQQPNDELGFAISVPLYENVQDFPGGAQNPEIQSLKANLRPHTYSHRVEGRPAPSELLVFKETFTRGRDPFWARRMKFVPHDENGNRKPVEICVDPGHRPSFYTVHFVQEQAGEICVVDEVAMLGSFHEEVILECRRRPAWLNVTGGTIDPFAAKQHGLGYKQTPWDIWLEETGFELRLPQPAPTPVEIIDRYLFYLRHPHTGACRIYYDPVACPRYDYEVRHWRYDRDPEGKPIRTEPQKKNCDGIKGVGYHLIDKFARSAWTRRPRPRPRVGAWRLR